MEVLSKTLVLNIYI